ncbi:hypothetical protein PVAP13_9NG587600 [Panicum virgatum]|uniref:Uncharacterized protein n=1 Tax=Panicum virgatum TaxID=38727 RepID=A0A8T0MTU6_PANVG|nr:hypothetical protein PVAP13_9NG587600 [Panicum virgatum]
MGLLDKLWDDTVAGPRPDTGLGRLRKQPVRPAAVKINGERGGRRRRSKRENTRKIQPLVAVVPFDLTDRLVPVGRTDPAGDAAAFVPPSPASGSEETPVKVTRSIMIKRPAGYPSSPRSAASTPPASPLGTTPPISPFAGAGGRFRRKSSSDAYERASPPGTTSPTPPFEV